MNDQVAPHCVLIADDLTGACDTGVQFARHGLSCSVFIDLSRVTSWSSNVVAINTDSRCDDLNVAKAKIQQTSDLCAEVRPGTLLKKIDSTLRGNVGQEILATMAGFRRDYAIIAPAFPAMGRTVKDGILEWNDGTAPRTMDIRKLLEEQGIPAKYMESGSANAAPGFFRGVTIGRKFFVADSTNQAALDELAFVMQNLGHHLLWVGSGGLGLVLARQLGKSLTHRVPQAKDSPVLFWIGSTHPVTVRQRGMLIAKSDTVEVTADPSVLETACRAIREKRHLVVSVERDDVSRDSVAAFLHGLKDLSLSAMVLTGGDTAAQACQALGVESIQVMDEIAPGVPWGFFRGGTFNDLPVVTKAGGFGSPEALLHCASAFTSYRKAPA